MERTHNWAIFYKGKTIPVGDDTIRWIRQDSTEVWGWFDTELMLAWKNMFPLTEISKLVGYLPMEDEAWKLTPNPWWRFLTDRPTVPTPLMNNFGLLAQKSKVQPLEKFLTEAEQEWIQPVITGRMILQVAPVECVMMGNLHWVKLLQVAEPMIPGTILIRAS
nr:hypothetical protein CFP56_70683 [Quercus suber]